MNSPSMFLTPIPAPTEAKKAQSSSKDMTQYGQTIFSPKNESTSTVEESQSNVDSIFESNPFDQNDKPCTDFQNTGDVPNSQGEPTHQVVKLSEQLGALQMTDKFLKSAFDPLQAQATVDTHQSPPLTAQDDLCPSFMSRKRFFSSIHDGLDKKGEGEADHISFFDGFSASNMSTNFSYAEASDTKSINGQIDPRTLSPQELLNRITKIWSNMSLVQKELKVSCKPYRQQSTDALDSISEVGDPSGFTKIVLSNQIQIQNSGIEAKLGAIQSQAQSSNHKIAMIADLVSDVFKTDVSAESVSTGPTTAIKAAGSKIEMPRFLHTLRAAAQKPEELEQADFELAHLAPIIDEL